MKKVFLGVLATLALTTASVFGMYGDDSGWIDLLTHGNQMRARVDRFGVVLGNGTFKGVFGFKGNNVIFNSSDGVNFKFNPVLSAGFGYTTEAFGIGVGYNYRSAEKNLDVHTPVLAMNFLNNNLRIVIPVQVAISDKLAGIKNYTGISTETQIRYYTGLDFLSQLRLYVRYGMNKTEWKTPLANGTTTPNSFASSLGLEMRMYFGAQAGEMPLQPIVKVKYNTSLEGKGYTGGTRSVLSYSRALSHKATTTSGNNFVLDRNAYDLSATLALGMSAGTDIVSIYVEPSLGYKTVDEGLKGKKATHELAWGAYGEIYVTPVKDLEWYFEVDAGNDGKGNDAGTVAFATSTGITWYLPALN